MKRLIAATVLGVGLVTLALFGLATAQVQPAVPTLHAYTVTLEQGGTVVCVVAEHYGGMAIDCEWDRP